MVKLDQLRVLRAVVETGSVKAASERLHRTQPAVSQALKALEVQTGTELFDRSGYRLELTKIGRRVYLQSLRVLAEADDLAQLVRHFEEGREETITLAIDAGTDPDLVTPVLGRIQTAFPETRVVLRAEVLSGAIDAVKSGKAALAVAPMLPVMLEEEGFEHRPIGRVIMRNVAAPALIAAMGTLGRLSELRRFTQVIAQDSGQATGLFDREIGVQKGQRRWYVADLHSKRALLVAGLGWGRLPEHMIAGDLERGALQEIALPHTHLPFEAGVYVFRQARPVTGSVAAAIWNGFAQFAERPS